MPEFTFHVLGLKTYSTKLGFQQILNLLTINVASTTRAFQS